MTNARSMRRGLRAAAVLLASASFGLASMASASDSQPANLGVTAAVTSNCHLTGGSIPFGDIDVTTGDLEDHEGTITIKCTNGTDYSLTADKGTGGTSVTDRALTGTNDSTNTLKYALYRDTGHTQNWGETAATDDIPGTGDGTDHTITIYGRVLAGQQTVKKDDYTDTVVVTVTYN